MNKEKKAKKMPSWAVVVAALSAAAVVFRFVMRGYSYIAHTLIFIAALIVMHRFFGKTLWRIVVVLVCIGFAYFIAVEVPIVKNARTDPDPGREYLIVLGAAVHGENPSLAMVHRVEGAQAYLEQYPDSIAIVSGGQGDGEAVSEAQAMYKLLTEGGIAPERIIMEDKSTSTTENLENSFAIIRAMGGEPDGNTAIVSSPYHLFRAKSMAALQGVTAAGVAAPAGYPLTTLNYFIREAFGVTHLWVFGR